MNTHSTTKSDGHVIERGTKDTIESVLQIKDQEHATRITTPDGVKVEASSGTSQADADRQAWDKVDIARHGR